MTARPAKRAVRRQRPEQAIQIACVDFLRAALPMAFIWHVPNEGKRSEVEGGVLKRMGLQPGFPDVAILLQARLYIAECKAPGKHLTAEQEACVRALHAAGARYLGVWRSIEDAERMCRHAGLPLRATTMPGGGWRTA